MGRGRVGIGQRAGDAANERRAGVRIRDAQRQVSHVRVPFERVRSKIVAWPIEVLQGDAKSWERRQVESRGGKRGKSEPKCESGVTRVPGSVNSVTDSRLRSANRARSATCGNLR